MSRTDAHRPRWVWLNDHPGLVREHHNHDGGACDLPVAPFTDANGSFAPGLSCWVDLDWWVRTCSCDMCSGRSFRRFARRQARSAQRTLLRAAAATSDEDQLDRLEAAMARIEACSIW